MNSFTKEDLHRLYVDYGLPMHSVAKELGVATGTVYNYLHRYGIETREPRKGMAGKHVSDETKAKLSNALKGRAVSEETRARMSEGSKDGGIGHKKHRADGYIAIYFPDHPYSTKQGYIMEHVLVMEALIGRHLRPDECVHHINEIRDDNRKENLQLMTKKEHMSYHSKKRWDEKKGGMTY